jgi:GDP-4-dehydro-6-deoxy-D-mannose reductase
LWLLLIADAFIAETSLASPARGLIRRRVCGMDIEIRRRTLSESGKTTVRRTVLATGAAGFAGRRLCERLTSRGWSVIASDRDWSEPAGFPCDFRSPDQIAHLARRIADSGASHVLHLAAVSAPGQAAQAPALAYEVNALGVLRLLEGLRRQAWAGRFIYIGSSEAYGRPESLPLYEEHPLRPVNPYGISKAAAEQFCRWAHSEWSMDIVCARPFNHAGPGQHDSFVLSSFARQAAEGERVNRPMRVGNLNVRRDFSHVDDVVDAYEILAVKGESGAVYNVCSGRSMLLKQVVEMLQGLTRRPIRVEKDPRRVRASDVPDIYGANDRLRALGWRPEKDVEQVLAELLDYWRAADAPAAP